MITIGLTGSIGTGKSTTAKLFAQEGVAVYDSDAVVHQIYEGEAAALVENAFPGTTQDGKVDRQKLGDILRKNPANFKTLEKIVHPLVRQKQDEFLKQARHANGEFALLDIPLLFETCAENRVDAVVVVSCSPERQRQRVLARPGMTEEKFELILARQMPDEEKRSRADFVIDTNTSVDDAHAQVRAVLETLRSAREERDNDA